MQSCTPLLATGLPRCKVKAVACGSCHTVIAFASGEVFAWGRNNNGQLGLGDTTTRTEPTLIPVLQMAPHVLSLACGYDFSAALLESNDLLMWGGNVNGSCGIGDELRNVTLPTKVHKLATKKAAVKTVACGSWHTAAVLWNGELFTWGRNECGQLGLGSTLYRSTPKKVNLSGNFVVAVACGFNNTAALFDNGECWSWGSNIFGQLGTGDTHAAFYPQQVKLRGKAVALSCGFDHAVAVLDNGKVFGWGRNSDNLQLTDRHHGNQPIPQEISGFPPGMLPTAVACGGNHTAVLCRPPHW
eukprot:TRINITY_DN2077_c0_g1_i2.p1 TRINITY_DN2077_c0_g1~~TRINITY_DN2077_c0_g1_i2.p1  ORF type:complete len:300 (+),score=43.68 TRINITY_DN2077_c0_g1_i2:978-1877(+)